jgi:hypothetical protein
MHALPIYTCGRARCNMYTRSPMGGRRKYEPWVLQSVIVYLYDVDGRTCHKGLTRCAVHLVAVSCILTCCPVQLAAVSNLSLGIETFHTSWCYLITKQVIGKKSLLQGPSVSKAQGCRCEDNTTHQCNGVLNSNPRGSVPAHQPRRPTIITLPHEAPPDLHSSGAYIDLNESLHLALRNHPIPAPEQRETVMSVTRLYGLAYCFG